MGAREGSQVNGQATSNRAAADTCSDEVAK